MRKGVILLVLCIGLCIPSQVFATDKNDVQIDVSGDLTLEEGAELYAPTQEEIAIKQQNLSEIKGLSLQRAVIYKTLDVPTCKQINGYYCGPATVQQTIKFLNGSTLDQGEYARQLGTTTAGTDMTRIPGVLNSNTNKNYAYYAIGDYTNWCEMIISALTNKNRPPVIDINTMSVSEWPYVTDGHYLNISGYNNNPYVNVRVTDPFEKGLGNHWYSGPVVYKANNDHWRKAMIW